MQRPKRFVPKTRPLRKKKAACVGKGHTRVTSSTPSDAAESN